MFNIDVDAKYNDYTLEEQTITITCDEEGWENFVCEHRSNDDGTMFVKVGIKVFEELIYLCPGIIQVRKNITTTDNNLLNDAVCVGVQYIEIPSVEIKRNND